MSDVYSNERAGYAERLARLAGGTTWREPMQGHGTKMDNLPDVHALAASLAFARQGPDDIGPDVAFAIICQKPTHRERVVAKLSEALLKLAGHVAERCADHLPQVSAACYAHVCSGQYVQAPDGVGERDWEILSAVAVNQLWDAVSVSVRRAEYAYRAAA